MQQTTTTNTATATGYATGPWLRLSNQTIFAVPNLSVRIVKNSLVRTFGRDLYVATLTGEWCYRYDSPDGIAIREFVGWITPEQGIVEREAWYEAEYQRELERFNRYNTGGQLDPEVEPPTRTPLCRHAHPVCQECQFPF